MRTTLTLDPDVVALLAKYRKTHDLGLKDAVNRALRAGLEVALNPPRHRQRFITQSVDHGRLRVPNVDDVSGILDSLDPHPSP